MKAVLVLVAVFAIAVAAQALPLSAPSPPPLASSSWRIEVVGLFGGSSEPDIALDSYGIPHVLYCPPGDEEYATRNASGWTSEHVVFTIFGGGCGELALGPGDVPHVTTLTAKGVLEELYGARINGTWDLSPYPGGSLWEVNSRGEPQLFALWRLGSGAYAARYVSRVNGTWVHEDLETFSSPLGLGEAWASLALDEGENPHVLYYDSARGDVRYAFRDSGAWHVEIVEHIGSMPFVGRNGGLVLDSVGAPHAIFLAMTGPSSDELRYGTRAAGAWSIEVVDTQASYPAISIGPDDRPQLSYVRLDYYDASSAHSETRLLHAVRTVGSWAFDTVLSATFDGATATGTAVQFTSLATDHCGYSHLAYFFTQRAGTNVTGSGAYYAANGACLSSSEATLRVEPRTLNLRSQGRWVSARIVVVNASVSDIDIASLALNGVPAARVEVLDNTTLTAKFDRQALAATLQPGDRVAVTLTGRWKDGGTFTASDAIRVIDPGGGHGKAP